MDIIIQNGRKFTFLLSNKHARVALKEISNNSKKLKVFTDDWMGVKGEFDTEFDAMSIF
jgi:hypothetical protein